MTDFSMSKIFLLRLLEVVRETADAVTLVFGQPRAGRIHYLPGQYLILGADRRGERIYRNYSLSSTPRLDDTLRVTVKKVPGGELSPEIVDQWRPGQEVLAMGPRGRFTIQPATKTREHFMLFGAGSGITPLMSMLREALICAPQSRVSLFYANRNGDSVIFREKIGQLQQAFPARLQVIHQLSQPTGTERFPYRSGRVRAGQLKAILQQFPQPPDLPASYFLCGPAGFMETVEAGLLASGVTAEAIQSEHFVVSTQDRSLRPPGPERTVTVHLGTEMRRVRVPSGTTILEAALNAGLDMPHACLRGVCASCMGQLCRGGVTMENDQALLPFEQEQGKILVCQALPTDDEVEIKVGG